MLRQPNTRAPERLWSRGERGRGVSGTRRLAGADVGAGFPGRGDWPGELHVYRLPWHSTARLLELLSGAREDHPKVVLE